MRARILVIAGLLLPGPWPGGRAASASQEQADPATGVPATDELQEVLVSARELRYVAPTLRDRLGRIWAPVFINGQGPYRLVLDTGASHSAVIAEVAQELGLMPVDTSGVLLRGVTGSVRVPVVRAGSLTVGDLTLTDQLLPIVPDALGGAQGVLGVDGMGDKRIFIDFMNDRISITYSHGARAPSGFITIPVRIDDRGLLRTQAYVGGVRTVIIIDTGGQVSVGNPALKQALLHRPSEAGLHDVMIEGATNDIRPGQSHVLPPLALGPAVIQGANIAFSDLPIFESWGFAQQPALLIGMDTLGLMDTLIIDYRRQELQVRLRGQG